MAGFGWTRRWTFGLFVLSAALLTAGEERAATPEKEPGRQFNSKLRFRVLVQLEDGQPPEKIGETPSEQPLAIPPCRSWQVEPLGKFDLAVVREVSEQRIPGLYLGDGSNEGLVHLGELKGLHTLALAARGGSRPGA